MILHDTNKSWTPPAGYRLSSFDTRGAYIYVKYVQLFFKPGTRTALGQNVVIVYLNDQGREVARTEECERFPILSEPEPPEPVSRRSRFLNGFYLVLAGLQEMTKCLKSW